MPDPNDAERVNPAPRVDLFKSTDRSTPSTTSSDAQAPRATWAAPAPMDDPRWSAPTPPPPGPSSAPTAPAATRPPSIDPARPGSRSPQSRNPVVLVALGVAIAIGVIAAVAVLGRDSDSGRSASGGTSTAASDASASSASQQSSPAESATSTAAPASSKPEDRMRAARTTAAALDRQLSRSALARAGVQPALDQIASCQADETHLDALRRAAAIRRDLIAAARAIDMSALPNGETLRTRLTALWEYSAVADDFYVRWGQAQLGCFGQAESDDAKAVGDMYSVRATAAKEAFLSLWNRTAAKYGLVQRDPGQI